LTVDNSRNGGARPNTHFIIHNIAGHHIQ
jgi:hypothetical protein